MVFLWLPGKESFPGFALALEMGTGFCPTSACGLGQNHLSFLTLTMGELPILCASLDHKHQRKYRGTERASGMVKHSVDAGFLSVCLGTVGFAINIYPLYKILTIQKNIQNKKKENPPFLLPLFLPNLFSQR